MRLRHLPAHLLSLVRIPLAALIWLRPEERSFFCAVLLVGGLSDVLDGFVARRLDRGSRADPHNPGAWLDPLCDKIFGISCVVAAFVAYRPQPWIAPLLLAREFAQVPVMAIWALSPSWRRRQVDWRANRVGKLTTVLQCAALGAVLFWRPALPWLASTVAVAGLFSVVLGVRRALRNRESP